MYPPKKSSGAGGTIAVGLTLIFFGVIFTAVSLWGLLFLVPGFVVIYLAYQEYLGHKAKVLAYQNILSQPRFYPQQPIIIQAQPVSTHTEVTREIVKVRCKSCSSLNFETANRCTNCGANL